MRLVLALAVCTPLLHPSPAITPAFPPCLCLLPQDEVLLEFHVDDTAADDKEDTLVEMAFHVPAGNEQWGVQEAGEDGEAAAPMPAAKVRQSSTDGCTIKPTTSIYLQRAPFCLRTVGSCPHISNCTEMAWSSMCVCQETSTAAQCGYEQLLDQCGCWTDGSAMHSASFAHGPGLLCYSP